MTKSVIVRIGFLLALSGLLAVPACNSPAAATGNPGDARSQPLTASVVKGQPADHTPVGGGCAYAEISGVARIVSVKPADPSLYNCRNDPVEVVFDFVPNDPTATGSYRFPAWADTGQHLTVSGGANPPRQWVLGAGLAPGTTRACVRSEITAGTCTPVIFTLSDVDYTKGAEACW